MSVVTVRLPITQMLLEAPHYICVARCRAARRHECVSQLVASSLYRHHSEWPTECAAASAPEVSVESAPPA
eukprot:6172476-Pleurochrysis_carterae.AAC.3